MLPFQFEAAASASPHTNTHTYTHNVYYICIYWAVEYYPLLEGGGRGPCFRVEYDAPLDDCVPALTGEVEVGRTSDWF